jgi:peptidyl-prolyl cis-trans isomerase A (cyclophilin A)
MVRRVEFTFSGDHMISKVLLTCFLFSTVSFAQPTPPTAKAKAPNQHKKSHTNRKAKKVFAIMETSMGTFKVQLYPDKAPKTVANFVELAEGKKEWKDPKTGKTVKKPLYNGTVFHRIIKGFMIQGGDPEGTGMGDPGYQFDNEISPALKHDKPGVLAMANAGPNTNGSQFYITVAAKPYLDGSYSIFGQVVEHMDVVQKISEVKTGDKDRPLVPVVLKSVKIVEK